MIQVDTIVHSKSFGCNGVVTALHADSFEVEWESTLNRDPIQYPYAHLVDVHGDGAHVQIIPNTTTKPEPITSHQFDRVMVMSGNIGRMEATLEILFESLFRVTAAMDAEGKPGVYREIDRMRNSIIRCGEKLQDLPKADGSVEVPSLKTYIASNK